MRLSAYGTASREKVENLELIYDLIFVCMIGRNNALREQFDLKCSYRARICA